MTSADSEHALSEVIGFVLILGVIVMALAMYQLYGVPALGRENEILHMNAVKDRLIDYKISLDSLWINALGSEILEGTTLSTSFDLGTEGGYTQGGGVYFPIMAPIPSGGAISINEISDDKITIQTVLDGVTEEPIKDLPLGEIAFQSDNNYWIQQRYYYQMGGLFLAQDSGSTVRLSPCFSISKLQADKLSVNVDVIEISGYQTTSGKGIARIDTRLRTGGISTESYPDKDSVIIVIDTPSDEKRAKAWAQVFRDAANRIGFTNIPEITSGTSDEPIYLRTENDGKRISITCQSEDDITSVNLDLTHPRFSISLQQVVT